MSAQAQLTLFSPVKINLYLRIVRKRPDGFHELETVMVPLDFGDTLTFALAEDHITISCNNPALPTDDSNLVIRAAKAIARRFNVTAGAHITLTKRAPLAAGIGSGSSNAAITLIGLNQLWKLNATADQLHEIAAALGSDINFFLTGTAALCGGRGEQISPIPFALQATVLLVNPGFGISTKWAYQRWAQTASGLTAAPPDITLLLRAVERNDLAGVCASLYNSLETPCLKKFPVLELLKRALREQGAAGALMSGSGSTVFGLFEAPQQAAQAAQALRNEFGPNLWTHVCAFRCPVV
ncbi:MAG: 4-(cytidine 5'-diphospho)-2-C-methyl-D-erythritol kinase [Verrucomicrobiae bacterium]|nr:4-(cytidine 5'-diphospho)-2-C-methyl-D-erythritol kinase [Verrucomicrobiae bacterium]